jgi:hypothetical protein
VFTLCEDGRCGLGRSSLAAVPAEDSAEAVFKLHPTARSFLFAIAKQEDNPSDAPDSKYDA